MISQRRAAQLGLLATGIVLISSLGILVGQSDESQTQSQKQTAPASINAPHHAESVAPVAMSTPIRAEQTGSLQP